MPPCEEKSVPNILINKPTFDIKCGDEILGKPVLLTVADKYRDNHTFYAIVTDIDVNSITVMHQGKSSICFGLNWSGTKSSIFPSDLINGSVKMSILNEKTEPWVRVGC